MKRSVYIVFLIALGIILLGKILNWFIEFSPVIESVLNVSMFSLVGLLYLAFAWAMDNKLTKLLFFLGGTFLLIYPWIDDPNDILGILAVLIVVLPLLLGKLKPGIPK